MNYKRKKSRTSGAHPVDQMNTTPSYWNILFHARPSRRRTKNNCMKVIKNTEEADGVVWDLDKKPHKYYW